MRVVPSNTGCRRYFEKYTPLPPAPNSHNLEIHNAYSIKKMLRIAVVQKQLCFPVLFDHVCSVAAFTELYFTDSCYGKVVLFYQLQF